MTETRRIPRCGTTRTREDDMTATSNSADHSGVDRRTTVVHSPADGGYYLEQSEVKAGRARFRVSRQVWPTEADARRFREEALRRAIRESCDAGVVPYIHVLKRQS
jgi:hypothetical protein